MIVAISEDIMPKGDAQRAWFPDMLEDLKSYWSTDWSWRGFSVFCEAMTEKRQKIMEARGIKPARMYCKECGSQMVLLPISIRSALFAILQLVKKGRWRYYITLLSCLILRTSELSEVDSCKTT